MFHGFNNTTIIAGESSGPAQVRLGQREIESFLPSFDPSKEDGMAAEDWAEAVTRKLAAFDVTEHQKIILCGFKMRGAARTWYQDNQKGYNTWEEFKTDFVQHFPDESIQESLKKKLGAHMKSTETVEEYVFTKKALARRGKYTDEHLTDFIIGGVPGEANRKILKHAHYATIPELTAGIKLLLGPREGATRSRKRSRSRSVNRRHRSRSGNRRRRSRSVDSHRRSRSRSGNRRSRSRSRNRRHRSRSSSPRRRGDRGYRGRENERESQSERGRRRDDVPKEKKRDKRCYLCQSTEHLLAKCPKNPDFKVNLVE